MKTAKRMVALVLVLLMAIAIVSTFMGCGLLDDSSDNQKKTNGQKTVKCNYCGGTGRVNGETCVWCNGRGYTNDSYFNDLLGE